MKPQPDEQLDEARLQALFDESAELASGPMLTKFSARAREIPALARRRTWWLSLRIALPAGAALAGALAVLMLPGFGGSNVAAPPSVPVAPASQIVASPVSPRVSESNDEAAAAEFAAGFGYADEGSGSAIALDAIESESEAELDAWLVATADLVDEGS
jgi:hypothetical protein